jgi:hypothetical protein
MVHLLGFVLKFKKGKGRGIFGGKKVEKSITFCESDK